MEAFDLTGRTAFVTGGAQGIGYALATALREAGAHIVIGDINPDTGTRAAREFDGDFVPIDVTDSSSVDAAFSQIVSDRGSLEIQVNNAGVVTNTPSEELPDEEWLKVINVNLNGVFFCSRAAGRHMLAQGRGSIINIGSMSGHIANRPQAQSAYNASKAGVIHLTKSLAAEWAGRGVRVNSISPGYVGTELTKRGLANKEWSKYWLDGTPLGRLAEPRELGPLAVYLASDASSYMTGSDVVIDGGYTAW